MDDNLKKVWQTLSEDYELPDYDTFKEDMKDEENLRSLWANAKKNYDLPDYDQFKADMGFGDSEEEGDGSVAYGTETDQAVESMNRNLGHRPQDVADTSGTPQFNGQSKAEKENPQMFQKPAVDPEPWKAEGLTKEQYEDIAWMRQANRPTPQGMINGEAWTPEEARAGEREQRPRTYQTKESWDDDISLKPSKYGQMRAGWRRGSRYRQLNMDGIYLGGYVAHTDADAAAQAEQMSDQQLIEAYNRLSQQINKNYEGGIGGFAKTPEGQQLAGQLNAIGKELHFRDLGYQHTSSVPGRGDVDYRSWTSDPDIAAEANRLSNSGNRDAEVARLYQQGLTSGNMVDAERALVASAALYCKENNVDMDTAYTKVETDAFNTAMRQPLEADVDKIYNEEKDVQQAKMDEAASKFRPTGDPETDNALGMSSVIEQRMAAPTRDMLNTMARRAINESAAARAYYGLMLREHMRGGTMDIIHARAAAMNDVRNLFRDREVARMAPDSNWGIVLGTGLSENLPAQLIRGAVNLISGDYESDMIFDEGMARAKASAGVMTNVLAGVAPFVADSALGAFKIPGLVGKAASTGTTKLATWSLNRMFGLGEEAAMRRLGGSWVYRTVTGALGGSANFGTYMGMSAAVSGFRQGNFSWGDTWQGAKHGAFDGLIFGGINGTMSKIIESAKGGWAIAAETGALATEAGVFTALDYMRTGEITAESVGQSLGMVLASRAMNFSGWVSDVAARVDGTKWQHQVKGPVRWSQETRDELQDRYPTLCRLMGGDNLAKDLVQGSTGKANRKTGNLKEVDAVQTANAIEHEWEQMQNDPTVDFAAKRMANYVLNGQIVPTPAVCNWRVGEVDDNGVSYGETLDINGNVIERFKLTNDKERRDFEQGVAHDAERNRLGIEEAAWRSREVDPVIANAIDAVASAHDIDPNELAQAYFSKDSDIKGKAMLAAVREAESLVMEEMRTKTNHRMAVEDKYGIDLEEVIKAPARDRTENEQRALDEYELRLTDHYDESQGKSGAELMQEEKQQAHDDGMQAEGEQRAELKERLEDAANTLLEMRIDPRQFDRMSEEEAAEWLAQHGNDEEAIDAVMEYMTAKAAFEGIRDRVQEESGKRIEESNRQTDERTNSDTGAIHPVKMKEGGEEGRDAFVIKGKIVVNQDGTIDTARSDKDITVFYPDTGEKKVMTIADVKSGEPTIDPEQAKQDAAQQITEEVAGQAADDMNRTLKFNQDDTFNVLVDGKEVELKVVGVDPESGNPILEDRQGRRAPAIPEMVQQMHDEWREWKRNGGEPAVEDGEGRVDNDADPKVEETPAEEQGPAVMPNTDGDPQEMLDYFRASGMSDKVADKTITNNIVAAAERLEKAQRELEESKETDPQKLADLDRAVQNAQRELDYWNEVGRRKWNNENPAEQQPAKAEEPLQSNGTENQPAEEPRPAAETGGEEYDGLGMSPELRERMDDGTGVVGLVDEIAKQLGLQVREFDGPSYMPGYIEDGVIWINRNREEGTRDTYRFTLGHELTHGLKEEALRLGRPDLYESLKNAALRTVQLREGSGYDAFVRNLTNRYQKAHYMDGYNKAIAAGKSEAEAVKAGQEQAARVTREFIEEEIVCDTIGELMSGDVEGAQRMMQQVEDKTLVQKFKDYIVNLLTKIRDSFARGSKEYNELDDTIAKWNEMYNEVMKEREEMQRGLESTIEDDAGNAIGKRASVSSTFEGMGFKFFDEELGEDGKRQAMEDEEGNLYVTLNGRKFDKDNHVTIEDVADVECPMNWMLRSGLDAGKITPLQQYRIQGNYVKLLNLFLDMGAAKNGGVSNLEDNYQMLGETVFRCISPNGDKQYTVSADITRICKKNEAVINTISELQRRQGYGATPAQILDIYMTTHNEGYQVPCPVCYVFSRYIRNGKFASSAINGMEMYGQHLPGGSDPWSVDRWVQELKKLGGLKDEGDDGGEKNEGSKMFKDMSKAANDAITRNLNLIDEQATKLANEMNKPNPDKAKIRQLETDIRRLADEYKKATDVFNQMSQTNWIKTFAIRKTKAGWVMWEDAKLPEDMEEFKEHALDLRLTASTIENYPAIQRLRRSGGSASGKEITQASNNEIGEAVMGIGQKGATKYNNYYKEAMETDNPVERDRLLKEAQKKFDNAVEFAAKQNLRGGQRMWSWSDNIERLSPDIVSNLMQLEILGSGLQSYSKQLEGVEMVARMNGYVNGSLMGKDDGYREVDESMFDKNTMRLTKDIVDVIFDTRLKENRDQIVAGEGAMVHEVDGKYYVLIYDDVLGISAHGRKDAEGNKVKMGLFDLNGQYNRAGNILVTMNDLHSKLALADDRVHFIIPWHSSGANSHVLAQMLNVLGQHIDTKSVDYTPMQEEKDMAKAKTAIPQHLHEVWDKARAHAEEKGWTCGIGKIDSNRDVLTKSQIRYRELRDAIMDGTIEVGSKEYKAIMADEFLRQTYEAVQEAGGKMTSDDKKYIYPYEYWIKTETDADGNVVPARIENADENGWRYMEYCRRLGRRPKFSGKYDGEKWSAAGDFTESKGYWKTLIDRRMYDIDGNFQDMTPIDSSGFDTDLVDRKATAEKYDVTTVADDEGVNRIVDIVQDTERTRIGEYLPNYGQGQNKAAKAMKPSIVTGKEKKEMQKRMSLSGEEQVRFSLVEDPEEVKRLDSEPKMEGYRNVSLQGDGTFRSPMANRLGRRGEKSRPTESFTLGQWEKADENPDLATDDGKINLKKPGGLGSVDNVDYNPYIHIRPTLVNKQFKNAWERDDLVYIKTQYPASEEQRGYHAEKAALSVGRHPWNGGELILSRWDKPVEIVPWERVADDWVAEFRNRGVEFDIVPPKLLPILAERGVEILPPHKGMGKACKDAYEAWKSKQAEGSQYLDNADGVRFSLTEVEIPELSEETRAFNDGQFAKYYEDNIKKAQEVYADGDIGEMGQVVRSFDYWVKKQQRTIKRDLKYWDESNPYIRRDRMWLELFQKVHEYATRLADDMMSNQEGYSSWGVKKNKVVTIDDIDRLFKAHNKDEYNDELWNRVLEVSRQLGVDDIKFKKTPDGVAGRVLGGRIRFDDERFNDSTVDDADKCETLLHEMLHHVTVYAINHTERLSEVQIKAVNLINSVFDSIKGDARFKDEYGIKNVKEMVAELSNPQFREKLKQKNLWERIVDGILYLFGFDASGLQFPKGMVAGNTVKTNAHDALRKHVETLLDNFNANAYTAFAEETRQYRPRFQLAEGETAAGVTLFSGGGLVEAGLRGVVDPRAAVEFDKKIAGVYRDNHGNHIVTADVRDVDPMELAKKVDGPVEYFHASPVCKNFSVLKNGGEKSLDIETAQSTANAIDKMHPRIVTIENVANYQRSDALKVIADKLDELGYTHDIHIVDAADYGAATHRRRLILRAVAPGNKLPAFPEGDKESFTPWFDRVSDLIADLPETDMPDWMAKRLANGGIYWKSIDRPLIAMSSGAAYGGIGHAFADEAAPTIAAGRTGDRIVMPDGKVYKVTGRVLARLMGLGDDYKLPQGESLAHTILGNGVPVELTKNIIGPLVKEIAEPSSPRFSLTDEQREAQTRSANFKRWFGDWENDPEHASKVVDEEGRPLVVWHGSGDARPNVFEKGDIGFHFGNYDQAMMRNYMTVDHEGVIRPFYLDIKNPLGLPRDSRNWNGNRLAQFFLTEKDVNEGGVLGLRQRAGADVNPFKSEEDIKRLSEISKMDTEESNAAMREFLKERGFDGIRYENEVEVSPDGENNYSYIAFDPTQIKSATDNNGGFSRENPDIRFSLSRRERDYTANVLKKLRKAGVNVQMATDEEAQRMLDAADKVVTQLMRGWHGSHANFDAFDHSHMGEGEGAQAYGWGTYITEVEGIARKYASAKPDAATIIKVSNGQRTVRVMEDLVNGMKKDLDENTRNLQNTKKWIDEAKKELADIIKQYGQDSFEFSDWHRQRDMQMEAWQDDANSYKRAIKSIKSRLPKYEEKLEEARELLKKIEDELNRPGGRFLYEITIPENDGTNYLPYNGQLSEETTDKLINAIKENLDKTKRDKATYEAEISALRDPAQQKFGDDWLKSLSNEDHARFNDLIEKQYVAIQREAHLKSALIKADMGDEFRYIQDQLEMAFGAKETSEFLSDLGFVGIEYPAMFRSGGRKDDAKNYVIFNEDDAQIVNKTEFLKTSDGTVYGWHDNDGIHLTAAGLNPNTPMHEYTHGLMAMLKEREPEKYQQIVEALKDSEVWQEVLNDELYSSIRDDVDAVASEVASRLSGRESDRRANESMPARIKRAIQELWETVAEWFGVKSPMTTDSIARMTLRELERGTNPDGDGPGGGTKGGDGPRFSLSEESQKIFDTAKRKFGETQDIREAGYVLPDGTMLDFSGRHELDPGSDSSHLAGRRHTDHRAVNQISFVYDENGDEVDTGVSSDMPDFIKRGAIRIDNNAGLINLSTKPTAGQRKVLRQLVAENGGTVDVDFGDGWDTDHHVEYNNAKATRVLGDIDRYFDEGIKPQSNVRFSLADTFYSNAARAVEGVKQEKAKAEQWKAMLTKAGGIKAGEDKWMGLSTWLDEHKGQTLTKEEVAQFVAENGIQMEETYYGEKTGPIELFDSPNSTNEMLVDGHPEYKVTIDGWSHECTITKNGDVIGTVAVATSSDADKVRNVIAADLGVTMPDKDIRLIDQTRLDYTTPGLENKREIAFVVPGVEPYQEHDEIHFGPENKGRAVMWVRFGEARDADGNRVLVIDEIQSNRHQDAREKGYKKPIPEDAPEVIAYNKANKEYQDYLNGLREKYGTQDLATAPLTEEEERRKEELTKVGIRAAEERFKFYEANGLAKFDKGVPTAPFEKNWHEVAMKRMLRLAAEEGFDKVAWTTGNQQTDRYNLGGVVESIEAPKSSQYREIRINFKDIYADHDTILVDENGIVDGESNTFDANGKHLSEVVGKELADKLLDNSNIGKVFSGNDLRIGGQGMRSFYDGILPQFMNKYGKRWGVKVGEVTLDTPGKETMHSVDVNEDMKRSVMQGQPLFQLTEDIENYQPRDVSWERAMLDRLMETAGRNREAVDKRRDALRTLNSQAGALRRAMSKQREYDRWTVDDLVSMAKSMLKSGLYKGMSPYEVQRLVGMINQGAGREDITRQANAVFDLMMKHHVKEWENQFNKLLRIRENKIDKNGVRVQGALDPKGQRMVKALRDGIALSNEALEDRIWDCRDRMGSDDPVVAGNAADEYEGLMHAQQHYDNIGRLNEALEELRHERRTQLERVYEYWREERVDDYGNVIYRQDGEPSTVEKRRVRPEFGGVDENGNRMPVSEENKAIRKQVDATVASIEQAMRETEVELAEGYRSLCDNVGGSVAGSITRAKEWVESEKDRVSEIQHAANSDLLNTEEKLSGMDRSKEKGIANNAVVRFVNSPLGSFEKFMRYFGQRSAYGEGRLYNKFMRGHSDCTDAEWRAYKEGLDAMNQKSEELFGCSWEKLMVKMRGGAFANTKGKLGIEREFPPVEVSYWVDGKRVDDTLNQDEVAYLIACSKMTDGMMKLENMGIDENMIAQLRQQVDPRMLQLADWYQHEFLPKQRTRINEVYKRMFGADMAHIDNYIHLNINERGLVENKDINQRMAASETPSTITGSLKERKRNTKPIDLHTSILDLALEEHQKMENWIAWAEYNRDLKDLLNYKKFKNKVYNMKSVELGSGEQLWDKFSKAVAVVTGDFQGGGKHSEMDRFATNAAKFVSSGCINFRVHTALKQVLSFPAFMSDARPGDILFAAGNAMGSVQWAMENLPGFSKRWESRRVGDTRLMDTDSDYSFWRNRWVKKVNKAGMTANASVDCLTVAIGARAVYETAKRRYLSYGYNEEQAERKALQDAYVSYNSSQQSSEGAFVSPMQVERTFLSAIGTTFRNASMGYQRRVTTGARNIARMLKKGYKEDMIENTKKQMMEEGLSEEQAQRAAERVYNRQLWHSMMDVANFGYALPFLWILGPTLSYLIAGDDDKIKKDTLADLARHAMFGPIEGLTFGGVMSELGNMVLNNRIQGKEWKDLWNELKNKDLTPLPLVSRMQGLVDSLGKGWWVGINDIAGLLIQSNIGVDPNTITDVGVAILDACNGDLDMSKEVALGLMRILQFPQSQIDNLYIDELGLNGKDLGKYSYEELARRYARYKTNRAVLPTVMRSDEANDAAEEKVMKRFEAKVKERLDAMDADQLGQVFDSGDPDLKKIIGAKVAKDAGLKNDRYGKKPDADTKPETAKAIETYQNRRNWGDISEDILLQQAKVGAAADGDDERAKKIEKALSTITSLRNGDSKKGIKGMGVDKKTDDRILKEIRETRSKALKELKISR